MDSSKHLDMEAMVELKGIMGEEFPLLIASFITDSEQRLSAIEQAIMQEDPVAVRHAAHTFKGSAGNLAARRLATLCRDLEEKGYSGKLGGCESLRVQIVEEYRCVEHLLKSV